LQLNALKAQVCGCHPVNSDVNGYNCSQVCRLAVVFQAEVEHSVLVCRLYVPTGEKPLSILMLLSMSLHDRLRIRPMQTVLPTAQLAAEAPGAKLISQAPFAYSSKVLAAQLLAALEASVAVHS